MIVAEGITLFAGPVWISELQWGRNLIVAEGSAVSSSVMLKTPLQWGRNLIVAEGIGFGRPWRSCLCFNGAAT